MQLKTNIIGLFLISVFIGCGIFESNEDISVSDKVYVALQGEDIVRVVNFETGALKSIAINYDNDGNEPHFISIDEINRYWFVTAFKSGWVARYNLDTNELIDKVMVGNKPALMVLNKADKKLYVSRMMSMMGNVNNSTSIQEIDYSDPGTMTAIDYEIGAPDPHGIAINSDGSEVYTASYGSDWLFKLNLQLDPPYMEDITLEFGYSENQSDPNNNRLKPVQCVSVRDSLLLVSCQAGIWNAESNPGQVHLWNTNTMERKATWEFDVNSSPWHIINSLHTNRVYVVLKGDLYYEEYPDSDGVACLSYDGDSLNLEWLVNSNEFKRLHGIDISDDGHRLYVSGKIDGKLHVLDAESGDVLQSIYLGPEISSQPSGVASYSN